MILLLSHPPPIRDINCSWSASAFGDDHLVGSSIIKIPPEMDGMSCRPRKHSAVLNCTRSPSPFA